MWELTVTQPDIVYKRGGEMHISFCVAASGERSAERICDELKDAKIDITVKKHRKRRSLDANAYAWELLGRLAAKAGCSPKDIYREEIREIGGNYDIIPLRECAAERFIQAWSSRGTGWICDALGASKIAGYVNIIAYYGSSTYDTQQMSRLIDRIVADCKDQGIETLTPRELSGLVDRWEKR